MKVLVIGATGFLGSAITQSLQSRGHDIVAMVRSPRQLPNGVASRVADLSDISAVEAAVEPDVDVVVHAATPLGDWNLERAAVAAAQKALGHPSKKFIYVSGVWVLGPSTVAGDTTRHHDETSPVNPIALVEGRASLEADVLTSTVTGIVIRPGILHGRGAGIPALMTGWAIERGHGVFVGADDAVTWACVHVDDAAELVALAVEAGTRASILHAVSEPAVPVARIAAAADATVGGAGVARRWHPEEAAEELGFAFAEALALSQRVEATHTRSLGWRPTREGVIEDIHAGSYGDQTVMV